VLGKLIALLMLVLPASLRAELGRKLLGWDIDPTARIGRSLIMVKHLTMGPESSIGPFNMIRGLDELRLGRGATIASRNYIQAHPIAREVLARQKQEHDPSLILGDWSKLTVGHEIDVSDRVEIGDWAGLVGYRCQILTHSLDLVRDIQITSPVVIGERSAVMSGCILLSGTTVPARSIVSAGSVVTTKLTKEQTFYRGNPAEAVRELPDLRIFHRDEDAARRYHL
jgi:carbonic anhydrase/acetyltransferase-like protein (isoleucine patch superfamily)